MLVLSYILPQREHELRLRHDGFDFWIDDKGKVQRDQTMESDLEAMKWAPTVLSWVIYIPYRLYRFKHPINMPTVNEVRVMHE